MTLLELQNELGQVYYRAIKEQEGTLLVEWIGYVSSADVIKAVQEYMVKLDHVDYTKLLNDSSKGEGSWDEANEWLGQNWIPYVINKGLKQFAFVVSPDIFSAMSTDELYTQIPGTAFEMKTFQSKVDAAAWLKSA